jgi:hypothetical protein
MALATRDPRVNGNTFIARHARFIVPPCWLLAAALRAADAVRTGAAADWVGAAAFAGVAVMFYLVYRHLHLKRRADAGRDGGS